MGGRLNLRGFLTPCRLLRVALLASAALVALQLVQVDRHVMTTAPHRGGLAALILLQVALLAALAASFWPHPRIAQAAEWVTDRRARVWLVAFAAFEAPVLIGLAVDRHALYPGGSELTGMAGFVLAAGILLAARRSAGPGLRQPPALLPAHPPDRWIMLSIATLGLLTGSLMWAYAPPLAYGNFDSYRLFYASEGLLGRQPLDLAWYTYPYPLVIAATRLIADSVASIVVLQHLVRIALAIAVFRSLRDTHWLAAAASGLLIAFSPIGAYQAHELLDASLYSSGLVLLALLTLRTVERERPPSRWTLISIGILCGWTAILRPLGEALVVPLSVAAGLWSRSWRTPAWVAVGLAGALVILGIGQWRIDRHIIPGTDEEAFYAFPTIYLGLYDPGNGPVAQSFQAMLDSGECDYTLPPVRYEIARHWPHDLHNCAQAYNAAHGTRLSTRALYLESIRARPVQYLRVLAEESRLFLTHSDTGPLEIETGRFEQMPFMVQTFSPVDGCQGEHPLWTDIVAIDSWLAYTCTYPVSAGSMAADLVPRLYNPALDLAQPYRLQGQAAWGRFWAAAALLAFALLEGSPRLRPLVVLSSLFILYHAVFSTAAMFPQPRYVYFVLPFFLMLVAVIGVTLWEGIRALPSRAGRAVAVGLIAALPFLPAAVEPLWVDTEWTAWYFSNAQLEGRPALVQQTDVVTFDWGEGGPLPGGPVDGFSARWERTDLFEEATYTFAVRSDDGARLYLDGELIFDTWSPGFHDWGGVDRAVTAGRHHIRIEYFEEAGPASMQAGYYRKETP